MNLLETLQYTNGWKIQKIERSKLMRKKSLTKKKVKKNTEIITKFAVQLLLLIFLIGIIIYALP